MVRYAHFNPIDAHRACHLAAVRLFYKLSERRVAHSARRSKRRRAQALSQRRERLPITSDEAARRQIRLAQSRP